MSMQELFPPEHAGIPCSVAWIPPEHACYYEHAGIVSICYNPSMVSNLLLKPVRIHPSQDLHHANIVAINLKLTSLIVRFNKSIGSAESKIVFHEKLLTGILSRASCRGMIDKYLIFTNTTACWQCSQLALHYVNFARIQWKIYAPTVDLFVVYRFQLGVAGGRGFSPCWRWDYSWLWWCWCSSKAICSSLTTR